LPDDPGPWTIERVAAGDDPERLRNLACAADFTVVIAPETSGILANVTRELENAGARLLGSTPEAVELAADKARLAARLRALAIDTPPTRTIVPAAGLPCDVGFPAVLKPVDGAGSVDTFYLEDAGPLPARALAMPAAMLQPYVPGKPMSASFFVSHDGQAWPIAVGAQRMAIRDGRFEYLGGTVPAPCRDALVQLTPAVNAVVGLRGFVGVDFLWNAETRHATVLEINPRPTTSYVGLCRLVPPGWLAHLWLAACVPNGPDRQALAGLACRVHEKQGFVSFKASGEVVHDDAGVFLS
jgi:predicted ATP-grasp superfamily ATP-dependent carboligase